MLPLHGFKVLHPAALGLADGVQCCNSVRIFGSPFKGVSLNFKIFLDCP